MSNSVSFNINVELDIPYDVNPQIEEIKGFLMKVVEREMYRFGYDPSTVLISVNND